MKADRRERMYLLREGHFFGFGMGLLLSRWWWAAVAWGVVLMVLWGHSLWTVRDADCEECGDPLTATERGRRFCALCEQRGTD